MTSLPGNRALENARLGACLDAVWPKVIAGDDRALDVWLRLAARVANLNGFDDRPRTG